MIGLSRVAFMSMSFVLFACGNTTNVSPSKNEVDAEIPKAAEDETEIDAQGYVSLETESKWLAHVDLKTSQPVKDLFTDMRNAAKDDNADAIADLVCFPFPKINNGVLEKLYDNKFEFLLDYHTIISPYANEALKNASYDDFWANSDGGMISSGAIWFNQCGGSLKIIRING